MDSINKPRLLILFTLGLIVAPINALAETLVTKSSGDWNVLNQATDPALTDTDFDTTWFNPTIGGYTGGTYDGPVFVTSQTAPFRNGGISGFSEPTTILANRVTTYFHKIVDGGSNGYENLNLSAIADDGAFIYLNGTLIAYKNISDPDTFDTSSDGVGSESTYADVTFIGTPTLTPGPNLLAVSLHNNTGSSDIGLDLELTGDPILISEENNGWAVLNPIDPTTGNGFDPALGHSTQAADADFNTTWKNQSFGGYAGNVYDGPGFIPNQQAPFIYGNISGIPNPNTTLTEPNSSTRRTVYFVKEFDGGSTGFNKGTFKILADDGAYVYLNGNLVGVIGDLPNDANLDTWNQMASSWSGTEDTFHTFAVTGTNLIQPGSNLLAISVHQESTSSSDLGLSVRLVGQEVIAPTIARGPYLQSASHDRMTIKWRTADNADTVLRYGDAPENLTQTITINESVTDHTVTLTGLSPSTTYYYQVESTNLIGTENAGADTDYYFKTHPSPNARVPTRIWVIGDSGTTGSGKMNVYNSYRTRTGNTHTDAWLMLGDNAYNTGSDQEFQAAVFDSYPELLRNTVLWSCKGNHESDYGNTSVYDEIHHFPTAGECGGIPSGSELYYSFDHGNIHFVCINTTGSVDINDVPGDGGMIDWLELDLKSTDKDWIIAYFHHGPYTKGSHNSDTESRHIKARRYITPLLEKYGADLVLSGHSHCYERSMLVNGHHSSMSAADSKSDTFVIGTHGVDAGNGSTLGSIDALGNFQTSGASGNYEKPLATGETGTIYSIVGASGKLSGWHEDETGSIVNPTPHPVFIVNLRVLGSMVININGNTLNAQYIDDGNTIRDDFTIIKGTTVQVTATDATFDEFGADNTASFTITRTGATSFAETIDYTISGTATEGIDYTPVLSGSASFASGETSKVLTVIRATDDLAEGEESISVTLSSAQQSAGMGGSARDRYFIGTNTNDSATLTDNPSQLWWFNNFGTATVSNTMWKSDTDNDGLDRLMEYAFGGTVGTHDVERLPTHQLNGNTLELLYNKNNALTDISYTAFTSTDMISWTQTGVSNTLNDAPNPDGVEAWKSSADLGPAEEKRFLKLEINRQ